MGAGVTDLVEMLEAFEASQKWRPPETAIEGGLVIQTELVMSPYGGLPAAIGNHLASAVSEGEAR